MEEKIIVKLEADIADLKTQLSAAEGELKRFGLGVQTSIETITLDRLNAQLKQLQTQLGATDIGSTAFKNIGTQIAAVESQINGALTSINANANKSKTGFNGLNNSINQLTRELPAFGLSANIGFLAISNNLPILFDEIKKVSAANKELAATGVSTTSVFKQLTSALFSWQSALSIGVTLLTVYGGKIIELISNLWKVEEGFSGAKAELQGLDEVFKSKSLGNTIGEIVLLKSSLETAGKTIQGQKQFVEQYNKTIGTVTGSVNSFKEAEVGIIAGTDAYINAMVQRAIAIKFADEAGQLLLDKEEIRAKQAIRIKESANSYLLKAEEDYANNTNPEETKISGLYYYGQKRKDYIKQSIEWQIAQQVEADKKEIASVDNKYKTFEKLSKDYYKKGGLITPYKTPEATKTDPLITNAKDMPFAPMITEIPKLNLYVVKLNENLTAVKTNLEGFKNTEPIWILDDNQIKNLQNAVDLLGGALSSAFDAALVSGENFFKVMWRGLTNLLYKLAAAAVAALVLSALLAPWMGGSYLASVGGFSGIFEKLSGFNIAGTENRIAMPSNTTGQGNYQIDIMGDKMRLLLDNTAIKNSRVI